MKNPKNETKGKPRVARRRNPVATRQAILSSARDAFTRFGYDGVGLRDIAENAGVTAMLVRHYFGSKEQLFEEVIEITLSAPGILTREVTEKDSAVAALGRDVAVALVARTAPEATPMDGFLILLRSAASEQAGKILREKFEKHFSEPLAAILPGRQADERAALFLAVIAGFQVMRQIVGLSALANAKPADLAGRLTAVFEQLVAEAPLG